MPKLESDSDVKYIDNEFKDMSLHSPEDDSVGNLNCKLYFYVIYYLFFLRNGILLLFIFLFRIYC